MTYVSHHAARLEDDGMVCEFEAVVNPHKPSEGLFSVRRSFRGKIIYDLESENALMFGEHFRDCIGYGPASDMLTEAGVPKESLIWKLGNKG